jgi:large subunit ribosomal protein L20
MTHKRHKKVTKRAEGYFGRKKNAFKHANEQLMKSGAYAFRDRRVRKRDFRQLWIARINAACRLNGVKYGDFIHALTEQGHQVNRKMLSEMAIHDPEGFASLVKQVVKA